jgi:MacB-like periplasmic core domain
MDSTKNLRVAIRTLAKAPAFTITVVLTLALGIGANSAVFSAINSVLLKPLPFPDGDQLMQLNQRSRRNANTFVAPVRLRDWEQKNSSFRAITGYYTQDSSELSGDLPEKVKQAFAAPRFLEVWGVAPALGRDFTTDELRFGGPNAMASGVNVSTPIPALSAKRSGSAKRLTRLLASCLRRSSFPIAMSRYGARSSWMRHTHKPGSSRGSP